MLNAGSNLYLYFVFYCAWNEMSIIIIDCCRFWGILLVIALYFDICNDYYRNRKSQQMWKLGSMNES